LRDAAAPPIIATDQARFNPGKGCGKAGWDGGGRIRLG
jgi:hypothetical protein